MIAVAGISHHTAPLAVRERFAVDAGNLPAALERLRERYGAAVLLSTCNRTEIYLSADSAGGAAGSPALALVGLHPHMAPPEAIYELRGRAAARHLLRVAAGLDSLILGEDQILGQVRGAFTAAVEAHAADHVLSRLFHLAIATGRRVRTETTLSRHARSVSAAAVEAVRERLGDLAGRRLLVLGAGEAGKLTARSLAGCGVGRLIVVNRTLAHAAALAAPLGAEAMAIEGLAVVLAQVDAVICASAAPSYQVTPELLKPVHGRSARPLLLIDIAVPRDVDPACAAEPGVTLLDLDRLGDGEDGGVGAAGAITAAEAIVEAEVTGLVAWWETLQVVPTISALHDRAEAIRRTELARTFGRLPDLTPRERARIEALSAAIVSKLLHAPISKLKQPGTGERYAALVHDLFDLPVAGPAEDGR